MSPALTCTLPPDCIGMPKTFFPVPGPILLYTECYPFLLRHNDVKIKLP